MEKTFIEKGWKIAYLTDSKYSELKREPTLISDFSKDIFGIINAKVPSSFISELYAGGIIDDPYYSDNVLSLRKYETTHQWWFVKFDCEKKFDELHFEGVDTVSEIFLNGKMIGKTDNAFIPYVFPVGDLKEKDNELIVHIFPALTEAMKYPVTSGEYAMKYSFATLSLRKPAYSFGWDIMPRVPLGGIWKEVSLCHEEKERITETHLFSAFFSLDPVSVGVNLFYRVNINAEEISHYEIQMNGVLNDSTFSSRQKLWFTSGRTFAIVKNPLLWNVRGYGKQNIYDVSVKLLKDGTVIDEKNLKFGLRKIELVKTSLGENGKFEFIVNGEEVFIKGVNHVPVDALKPYNVSRMLRVLENAKELGSNMIRVWGGGVYEPDEFYDFCDREGILVWQDFMFACAVYPETDEFLSRVKKESEIVVKRLRIHPCLALWCGDNECDISYGFYGFNRKPFYHKLTREVLFDAVRQNDPTGNYLHSSPFVDEENFDCRDKASENHIWRETEWFRSEGYKNNDVKFISEIGYFSFPCTNFLNKYLKTPDVVFEQDGKIPTVEYATHSSSPEQKGGPFAYRIGRATEHVKRLFVDASDDVKVFAKQSQISGAEAMKSFVEHIRRNTNRNGGILLWNLIDGWPNISEALIDYGFNRKLAFDYVKRSFEPVLLACEEIEGKTVLFGANDEKDEVICSWKIVNVLSGDTVAQGENAISGRSSVEFGKFDLNKKEMYLIKWKDNRGAYGWNHYYTDAIDISFEKYVKEMNKVGYVFNGFDN